MLRYIFDSIDVKKLFYIRPFLIEVVPIKFAVLISEEESDSSIEESISFGFDNNFFPSSESLSISLFTSPLICC